MMSLIKSIVSAIAILLSISACKKSTEDKKGIPTIIRGLVTDDFRGLKIENYEIKLYKSIPCFKSFMSSDCGGEVATVKTDKNGSFLIQFNHYLNNGESYALDISQYPYTSEPKTKILFTPGKENVVDINAWKPVILRLNLDIKNNVVKPIIAGINYKDNYNFGTEFTYERDIKKTLELRARPNSDILIDFWYNENYNSGNPIRHLKSFSYKTSLAAITDLSYEIDCAKF